MKRTVLLIIALIILSTSLLIYALSATPNKKKLPTLQNTITPTQRVTSKEAAETTLSFTPESIVLGATNSANFSININSGNNQLTAVQLEIAYDPKIVSITSIKPGTFFPTANVLLNINDTDSGRISYALVIPLSQSPVSGTGTIATLTIKKKPTVITAEQTSLTILPKTLVSAMGVEGSVLKDAKSTSISFLQSYPTISIVPSTVTNTVPR